MSRFLYLAPTQILFIHSEIIAETGGTNGVRDLNLLESAAARPQSSFDGHDLYQNIFTKSAALFESLVRNHPFIDGNKRTALSANGLTLELNGYNLQTTKDEDVLITLKIAENLVTFEEISAWLKKHSQTIK